MDKMLKMHFSDIEDLYDYQKNVLDSILEGNNSLAIIPTGGGKSLIYQLGAMMLEGTTIVISPLKALMQEQVDDLNSRGIEAIAINSDMDFQTQRKVLKDLGGKKPKLIYVSPERLNNYYFRSALSYMERKIPLVVIDEAHCISQWGFDFRPDYSKIKPFINFLEGIGHNPITLALTATLSSQPRKGIIQEFNIDKKNMLIEDNVIRDNLVLEFKKVEKDEAKIGEIREFIDSKDLKKVLVYTYSRPKCEELASQFDNSDFFHAGLSPDGKLNVYKRFKNGDIRVLFATTAFGMGMNIPDIDGVIHYQIPESIEEYYQHVGRGGRDKEICPLCHCLFLWSDKNFDVKRQRIESRTLKDEELIEGFQWINPRNRKGFVKELNSEELWRNDGSKGTINLRLMVPVFEKYKLIEIVGEINGKPKSITFKNPTELWNKVLSSLSGIRNSYTYAEKKTGIKIQEIINHLYEEEFKGNIDKIPAMEKLIMIKVNSDVIPEEVKEAILKESKEIEKHKISMLGMLKELCTEENKEKFIAERLGVPYQ